MEVQTESLEITTSILENINILVERPKKSIPIIQVNTNEEKTKEKVVVIGANQPKKIEKNKVICAKMVKIEIDKPKLTNQVKLVNLNYP
jgi:hypothetical protein